MDDEKIALATKEIQNIDAIAEITPIWPNHELENYELLNSTGIDYAPIVSENQLFFTSSRGAGGMYAGTGQGYTRLFKTRAEGINVDVQGVQTLNEFRNESGLNQGAIAIKTFLMLAYLVPHSMVVDLLSPPIWVLMGNQNIGIPPHHLALMVKPFILPQTGLEAMEEQTYTKPLKWQVGILVKV